MSQCTEFHLQLYKELNFKSIIGRRKPSYRFSNKPVLWGTDDAGDVEMFTLLFGVPAPAEFLIEPLAGVPSTLRNVFSSLLSTATLLGGVCEAQVEGVKEKTQEWKNRNIFSLICDFHHFYLLQCSIHKWRDATCNRIREFKHWRHR